VQKQNIHFSPKVEWKLVQTMKSTVFHSETMILMS